MEAEFALEGSSSHVNNNKPFDEVIENKNDAVEHDNKEKLTDDIEEIEEEMNEEIKEPRAGMMFDSEKEVETYYAKFAQKKGFAILKRTSKNDVDGKKYFTISCARARKLVSQRSKLLKLNPTTKTQCKARLNACLGLDGKVKITSVILDHNHEMSPGKARFFRCNRKIESQVKKRLEINDRAGISVNKNFQSLVVEAGGYENLTFSQKDCKNYIEKARRLRLGIGDAKAVQEYFHRMQEQNNNFYYMMDLDEECRLRNVFWADARSRAAYEYFGDVVTFDTTYLTNKYDMPFAPFVGVNHHGQSILLGCVLLSNEDTKTFTWLFKTWLTCMSGRVLSAIITDQDKAMQNAIEVVFPKARHRWCLWHVMKKVPEKLRGYSDYESIKSMLHDVVYDSFSKEDFMESWKKIIVDYNLHDNEWFNGLYNERHRWLPVYVKDTFWAGMSTTQRSESMNAFFDGYVNSKTTLKQFMEQYDNALRDKVEKECLADFNSFNTLIPCVSVYGIECQFQKVYTNTKFKEFQEEVASVMYCNACFQRQEGSILTFSVIETKKVYDRMKYIPFVVCFNEEDFEVKCACHLFEFRGILCRHILSVLNHVRKTESVPSKYVFSLWRKDLKRRHTLVKSSYNDYTANIETQWLDKVCNAFYEVASVGVNSDVML